jgi:hypothetical protein
MKLLKILLEENKEHVKTAANQNFASSSFNKWTGSSVTYA